MGSLELEHMPEFRPWDSPGARRMDCFVLPSGTNQVCLRNLMLFLDVVLHVVCRMECSVVVHPTLVQNQSHHSFTIHTGVSSHRLHTYISIAIKIS